MMEFFLKLILELQKKKKKNWFSYGATALLVPAFVFLGNVN
jgi:hypothetical protein